MSIEENQTSYIKYRKITFCSSFHNNFFYNMLFDICVYAGQFFLYGEKSLNTHQTQILTKKRKVGGNKIVQTMGNI
jgi:hypothetical protein